MIANNSIIPDLRDFNSSLKGIELLEKLKIVTKSSVGVYCLLPLGAVLVSRLEETIKKCFNDFDCFEVRFPTLLTEKIWRKSLRWESFDSLLKIKDRSNKFMCLNPTHEEASVETLSNVIQSHKDLPITMYCLNKVYRDEIRVRNGLLRTKEFIMADAYSFAINSNSSNEQYKQLIEIHRLIFNRLGLKLIEAEADNGDIGGSLSQEFIYLYNLGESFLVGCENCNTWTTIMNHNQNDYCQICNHKLIQKRGAELAHIFQLDQIYTKTMGMRILNSKNNLEYPYMNCSGIGVTRLLQILVETEFDMNRKIAPSIISPFQIMICQNNMNESSEKSRELYKKLSQNGFRTLYDSRKLHVNQKLILSDMLNCSLNIFYETGLFKLQYKNQNLDVHESDIEILVEKILTRK